MHPNRTAFSDTAGGDGDTADDVVAVAAAVVVIIRPSPQTRQLTHS